MAGISAPKDCLTGLEADRAHLPGDREPIGVTE